MGFEACHPAVNLIYFAAVIFGMLGFQHPVFLAISFLCAFAYSLKRNGTKALVFNLCLLPCIAAFALYYSSLHHFGMTVLRQNFIGNNMTVESLVYGIVLGVSLAGVMIWMSCVYSVFSSDKVVYLFGKASPRLSLFLAILLRMVPRIKGEAKRIHTARKGLGKGIDQGSLWQRMKNGIRIFSMLISWTIGSLATMSDSMRIRGSVLRVSSAFSIYRFDNRDRIFVITLFACLTLTVMAILLGMTDMVYDPLILWEPMTGGSILLCIGYAALCVMPLLLELWTEYCFRAHRNNALAS